MPNPSGPYPGRQVFMGLTADRKPCFAYLITGRSPESRQRKAIQVENTVRIGPLGDVPYDPLRHYNAVKYDRASGVIAVTNGIQTEAIFETYKLLFNVNTPPTRDFLEKLMDGANFEADSLHTPRVGGVITGQNNPSLFISTKTHLGPAAAYQVTPSAGSLSGLATYRGSFDNPEPTDPKDAPFQIRFAGKTPDELARHLYDMSAASYKDEDIRVCTVAGICGANSWELAIINRS